MTVRILVGDAMQELGKLPDESVHCCVTSPPYWGLRIYYGGDPGMIGLEPTFDEHLEQSGAGVLARCGGCCGRTARSG